MNYIYTIKRIILFRTILSGAIRFKTILYTTATHFKMINVFGYYIYLYFYHTCKHRIEDVKLNVVKVVFII